MKEDEWVSWPTKNRPGPGPRVFLAESHQCNHTHREKRGVWVGEGERCFKKHPKTSIKRAKLAKS